MLTTDLQFKTEPYEHQLSCHLESRDKLNYAYFCEMGTGKSKILLDDTHYLYRNHKINLLIVVAPKGVYHNWVGECTTHLLGDYNLLMWTNSKSRKANRTQTEFLNDKTGQLKVFLVNVDACITKSGKEFLKKLLKVHNTLFAIDESTKIKNPQAKRTKAIVEMGRKAKYKRILTGQPIANNPLDVYSQAHFLDPSYLGHPHANLMQGFHMFRSRYAVLRDMRQGMRTFKVVTGFKRLNELKEKMRDFSYTISKEECLDLPDKVYQKRFVPMEKDQLKAYHSMKDQARVELENLDTCTAQIALTKLLRLRQLLCGFITTDEGEIKRFDHSRLETMNEVIQEMDGKVIVWANFKQSITEIYHYLEQKYGQGSTVCYYGDVPNDVRIEAIKYFNESPECKFFVGNPAVGGMGLTLVASHNMIYYSNGFSLEERLQSEDRIHRIGQTKKSNYVDLVVENSVDEKILEAIKSKFDLATRITFDQVRNWLI